jgi:hypothetical protein
MTSINTNFTLLSFTLTRYKSLKVVIRVTVLVVLKCLELFSNHNISNIRFSCRISQENRAGSWGAPNSGINRIYEKIETKNALLRRSQTEVVSDFYRDMVQC